MEAVFLHGDQTRIDYTPDGADVANGEVVILGNLTGICTTPGGILDGALGSLDIGGKSFYKFTKAAGDGVTFGVGDRIAWDDTAVTGNTAVAAGTGTKDIAICTVAALDDDDHVCGLLLPGLNAALDLFNGVVALTDNTAGTANDTLQALADGTTYANDVAAIRNNFADLAAKINALIAKGKT